MKIKLSLPTGLTFPTLVAAPAPAGQPTESLRLLENGKAIPCHIEVVHRDLQGRPLWLHVYALYTGGRKYSLEVSDLPAPAPTGAFADVPEWRVEVLDHREIIWGAHAAIADSRVYEINNEVLRVYYQEAWLEAQGAQVVAPFLRYKVRVTQFAGSPYIKFDHSVVFAGKMSDHRLEWVRIRFPGLVTPANSPLQAMLDGRSRTLTAPAFVHQRRFNKTNQGTFRQANGAFESKPVTICIRNFWEKYPQAVSVDHHGLTYYQWYGKGTEFAESERLDEKNLHKLYHWHHGKYLDAPAPSDWVAKMSEHLEVPELRQSYMAGAEMQGITLHDDFCLYSGDTPDLKTLQQVWQTNPVGYVQEDNHTCLYASEHKGSDFPDIENFLEQSILSYTDPKRYEAYGRFLYGESFRALNVIRNRPVLHRLYLGSYYSAGETYWRQYGRSGTPALLQLARRNTERYRAILQTSFDALKGQSTKDGLLEPGHRSETKFHQPGGFWLRGHWWGPDYGMPVSDTWQNGTGRGADPDALLLSYLLDGNRFHYDGYVLWYRSVVEKDDSGNILNNKFPVTGYGREVAKTLGACITAYEHFQDAALLDNIRGMTAGLTSVPFDQQLEPLWYPEWPERVYRHLDNSGQEALSAFLYKNYNPQGIGNAAPLTVAALLFDHSGDRAYLTNHLGWIAGLTQKVVRGYRQAGWENFGIGDGPLGDAWLKLQWPAFLKRLRAAQLTEADARPPEDAGLYPWSSTRLSFFEAQKRGGQILIHKTDTGPLHLQLDFYPWGLSGGDIHECQVWVERPNVQTDNPAPDLVVKLDANWAAKPVMLEKSRFFRRYQLTLPDIAPGLVKVHFAGHRIGLYSPVSAYPEAMLLKPNQSWPADTGVVYWLSNLKLAAKPVGVTQANLSITGNKEGEFTFGGGFIRANQTILRSGETTSIQISDASLLEVVTIGNGGQGLGEMRTDQAVLLSSRVDHLKQIFNLL